MHVAEDEHGVALDPHAGPTPTIASALTGNNARPLNLTGPTWAINDQVSSSTVTFNNSFGLYLGLNNTSTITVANASASLVLNTALSNDITAGGIIKAGAGRLTRGNSNSYTGGTTVNAGTLIVTGTVSSGLGLGYGGPSRSTVAARSPAPARSRRHDGEQRSGAGPGHGWQHRWQPCHQWLDGADVKVAILRVEIRSSHHAKVMPGTVWQQGRGDHPAPIRTTRCPGQSTTMSG